MKENKRKPLTLSLIFDRITLQNKRKGEKMEDRFKFTLDFLKEQFNNRLEIDTKEVSKVLDINESTL